MLKFLLFFNLITVLIFFYSIPSLFMFSYSLSLIPLNSFVGWLWASASLLKEREFISFLFKQLRKRWMEEIDWFGWLGSSPITHYSVIKEMKFLYEGGNQQSIQSIIPFIKTKEKKLKWNGVNKSTSLNQMSLIEGKIDCWWNGMELMVSFCCSLHWFHQITR